MTKPNLNGYKVRRIIAALISEHEAQAESMAYIIRNVNSLSADFVEKRALAAQGLSHKTKADLLELRGILDEIAADVECASSAQ